MRRALRISRRLATVLAAAALAGVAAPEASNTAAVVEPGVTVGGVSIGELGWSPAHQALRDALDRPLRFALDDREWTIAAERFGSSADLDAAVAASLRADPGAELPLEVGVAHDRIRAYVNAVASELDRPALDARIAGLEGLQPKIVPQRAGRALDRKALAAAIEQALASNNRPLIELELRPVAPEVRVADLPPVIVVQRNSRRLHLYERGKLVRTFAVATGAAGHATPLGDYTIATLQRHPWWYPPASPWARGLSPVPPGPGNPLGTRWMGLDRDAIGIHGTPNPSSIGTAASKGCIRMYTWEAEWLFDRLRIGTPVYVVGA